MTHKMSIGSVSASRGKNQEIIKQFNLEYLGPEEWNQVFEFWEEDETKLGTWTKHYEDRGFDSWKKWRGTFCDAFNCKKLDWNLYQIKDPISTFPKFYGGPFKAWIDKFYDGKKEMSFAELANLNEIQTYNRVLEIKNNFPQNTTVIGLILEGKIYIIEGMHRSCAVALMAKNKEEFRGHINIYLADFKGTKLPSPLLHEIVKK